MVMMMSDNPWAGCSERVNRFVKSDPRLAHRLNGLSEAQTRDERIAVAMEPGRIYGLRQQKYDMGLKRQLNRDADHPPVQPMW